MSLEVCGESGIIAWT